jgi:F-type H+-transporting ATPase subunit gamma
MAGAGKPCSVPYTQQGPEDAPYLLVLMTSDAGLCGGFNQKLIKTALEWLAERKNELIHVLCIGKKGLHVLQKKPGIILSFYEESLGSWQDHVISLFKNKGIRGCCVISGRFLNILTQEPQILSILPAVVMDGGEISLDLSRECHNGVLEQDGEPGRLMTIEPDANSVLNHVLELWIQASLKKRAQEHAISEYAARMNAMDSANDNAKDMIRRLQIKYNRLRQDRITKEIIEIISGSAAAQS